MPPCGLNVAEPKLRSVLPSFVVVGDAAVALEKGVWVPEREGREEAESDEPSVPIRLWVGGAMSLLLLLLLNTRFGCAWLGSSVNRPNWRCQVGCTVLLRVLPQI